MGIVVKRHYSKLIPEACDRHANKLDIYFTRGRLYHVNFRNLQIRLTKEEFEEWRKGFAIAAAKLGNRMANDTLQPWVEPAVETPTATQAQPGKAKRKQGSRLRVNG